MFGIFGRSQELQSLDRAFRTAGLNPRGVAEAVKLTTLKQLKEASPARAPDLRAYAAAAELIAYCVLGREAFTQSNDADQTESVEEPRQVILTQQQHSCDCNEIWPDHPG